MPSPEGAGKGKGDGTEPASMSSAEGRQGARSTACQSTLHKELLLMPLLQPVDGALGSAGFSTAWLYQ